MEIITAFILIILLAILLIPFVSVRWKGIVTVTAVIVLAVLSSIIAVQAMSGKQIEYLFQGSLVTGEIPVRIDALSGFFILSDQFHFSYRGFLWFAVYESIPESKSQSFSALYQFYTCSGKSYQYLFLTKFYCSFLLPGK